MQRYICLVMAVALVFPACLGCPASVRKANIHHAEAVTPGDGAVWHHLPADYDPLLNPPEVEVSEPMVSRREAVWFSDEVLFSARATPTGVNGSIAVIIGEGEDAACIANLNDIGWPPDEVAQDGIWAGRLDWTRVPAPGRDQPLRFAYLLDGKAYSPGAAGTIDLVEDTVAFTSFTCVPAEEVRRRDNLLFEAVLNREDVPGSVRVVSDNGWEFSLTDVTPPDTHQFPPVPRFTGQVAGDGVFNGVIEVPISLPVGRPVRFKAQYLDTTGEVTATSKPVTITVLQPEIYLTGFTCEPNGPLEIGEPIRLKAELNRTDTVQEVRVYVEGPGLEKPVSVAHFDGTEFQQGSRQLTGNWEGEFEWDYELNKVGEELRVFARIKSDRHVISELEAPSIILLNPGVEITDVQLSEWPVLDYLQHVQVTARTSKPVRVGGLELQVNEGRHGSLVDDGGYHGSGATGYHDATADDGNWIGSVEWFSDLDDLTSVAGSPARVVYAFNDQVYDIYDLEPLIVHKVAGVKQVHFEPEGLIHLGDDVEIVVDMAKPCSTGQLSVNLEDGTRIGEYHRGLDGSRVVSRLVWDNLDGPGDYGPIIVTISLRKIPVVTYTGPPLVVVLPEWDENVEWDVTKMGGWSRREGDS